MMTQKLRIITIIVIILLSSIAYQMEQFYTCFMISYLLSLSSFSVNNNIWYSDI